MSPTRTTLPSQPLASRSLTEVRARAEELGLTLHSSEEELTQRLAVDEATLETLRSFDSAAPADADADAGSDDAGSADAGTTAPRWHGRRPTPQPPELETGRRHGPSWITVSNNPRTVPGDGPLVGWEVGIKDLMAVEAAPLTAGTHAHRTGLPRRDAVAVHALRAAGATIRGTTNLHALAYGATGISSDWGRPTNPAVPGAIPGGSSSGSAAAVAEGTAALTLGTDTSGSIRIPAALCGVVGLKPTRGLVSLEGCHPLAPTLDHIGPLARTVDAVALAMSVLAGWGDWHLPEEPEGPVRIGVLGGYFAQGLGQPVRAAVDRACERLAGAGVELVPVEMPLAEHIPGAQIALLGTEAVQSNLVTLRERGADLPDDVRLRLEAGLARTDEQYAASVTLAERFRDQVSAALGQCHALLSPTTAITATPPEVTHVEVDGGQATVQFSLTRLTMPFNFSGHPAITLPLREGTTDPVGLQLVGRTGEDQDLLALSAYVEQILA
ncbi:amidase [Ornithinimicrobium faecis]|uniref:Amidase n=1 Tax=Ornithinimicrobium faecis TaxID=2934158 RepID=A0ABY4YU71_9MICO|nr:amidase [Ornithinimicrobium sp. HY1793]USQ79908.1 amidase [Ornithinimicrobium sp. HY1793]